MFTHLYTNVKYLIFQNNLSCFLSFTGTEHNFQKFGWRVMQNLGVAYDTGKDVNFLLC